MRRPWEQARPDPPNLQVAEVVLTAWVEARCRKNWADRVRCDFKWFAADGTLADPVVEAGPVTAWPLLEEIAPPAAATVEGEEGAPAAAAAAGDAGGGGAAAPPEAPAALAPLLRSRFEQNSPKLQATCAFVRRLATSTFRVRVRVPVPGWTPPPANYEPPPPPDPKEKKPPAKGAAVVEVEPEATAEVVLELAPIIVLGQDGRLAEITAEGAVPCPGLESLRVGVRCSPAVLSESVAAHLNPLLVTLEGVHRLPSEEHLGQTRDRVYLTVKAFGEQFETPALAVDTRGKVNFHYHRVFFIGTWDQHQLREYLQTEDLLVEVHDRDAPPKLPEPPPPPARKPAAAEPPPAPPPKEEKGGKKGAAAAAPPKKAEEPPAPAAAPAPRVPTAEEMAVLKAAAIASSARGVVRAALADLVNPRLRRPLTIRADVEPVCGLARARPRGAGASADAAAGPEGSPGTRVPRFFEEGAQQLLASMSKISNDVVPGYMANGTFLALQMTLAISLKMPEPVVVQDDRAAGAASPPSPTSRELSGPLGPVDRYERYARLVFVLDYRKTALLKRLLALVADVNVRTLQLDAGQARALSSVQLTEAQKLDQDLDIVTGFIVMDRSTRIIVIEGLRHGAIQRAVEVLGVRDVKSGRRCKILHHPEVGFSERLYTRFNLCLKQVKLRQPTLESLTQRPELCLSIKADKEVATSLHQVAEIKRATRLHLLKANNLFPSAEGIIAIETQYGDFITDEELEGGCLPDGAQSQGSREATPRGASRGESKDRSLGASREATRRPLSKDASRGASRERHAAAATLKLAAPDDGSSAAEDDDEEVRAEDLAVTLEPVARQRQLRGGGAKPTEADNPAFRQRLAERAAKGAVDHIARHKEALSALSAEVSKALSEDPRKVGPRKVVDTAFLEGRQVYLYSGQKLNSAELQKQALRAGMEGQEGKKLWTYSKDMASGTFPVIDKEVTLDNMLRESTEVTDREKFRYPKPRDKAEFAKPTRDVSSARKEELKTPWVENELRSEEGPRVKAVPGAFDAKCLGTGGAHVIPLRRPGLQEPAGPPPASQPTPRAPPMKFSARGNVGFSSSLDKYTGMLDGQAPAPSNSAPSPRRAPAEGAGKPKVRVVEAPPISIALAEPWQPAPGSSDAITHYMKQVGRPLVPVGGVAAKEAAAKAAQGVPSGPPPFTRRTDGKDAPPLSARVSPGSQAWKAMLKGTEVRDARVPAAAAERRAAPAAAPLSAR